MGLFEIVPAADALADLFERERRAILAGRFDLLDRLGNEKERLFRAVERQRVGRSRLETLRRHARRNQDLLAAMERGVRAAVNRIATLNDGPVRLNTYGADGQRQVLGDPESALCRRA